MLLVAVIALYVGGRREEEEEDGEEEDEEEEEEGLKRGWENAHGIVVAQLSSVSFPVLWLNGPHAGRA